MEKDYTQRELWSQDELQEKVVDVAMKINVAYEDEQIILIGVLKGAVVFLADLMRYIYLDTRIDFVGCTSYGDGQESGKVTFTKKWEYDLDGQHVIIVDDIYDTGKTMNAIREEILAKHRPKSIQFCALVRRKDDSIPEPKFYALEAEKEDWIYGYGLDMAQYNRNLASIYRVDHK